MRRYERLLVLLLQFADIEFNYAICNNTVLANRKCLPFSFHFCLKIQFYHSFSLSVGENILC